MSALKCNYHKHQDTPLGECSDNGDATHKVAKYFTKKPYSLFLCTKHADSWGSLHPFSRVNKLA